MDNNNQMTPERHEISQMVKCRMHSLGQPMNDYDEVNDKRNTISYVIVNPSYDQKLQLDDVIYLIRPSSLSPQPSPLIDERKFHSNQTMTKREEPTGADNPDTELKCQKDCSNTHPETQRFGKAKSLSTLEQKPDISCDMRKSRTYSPADLRVIPDKSGESSENDWESDDCHSLEDSEEQPSFHLGNKTTDDNPSSQNAGISGTIV